MLSNSELSELNFFENCREFLRVYQEVEDNINDNSGTKINNSKKLKESLDHLEGKFSRYKKKSERDAEIENYFQDIQGKYILENFSKADKRELNQALTALKDATIDFLSNQNENSDHNNEFEEKILRDNEILSTEIPGSLSKEEEYIFSKTIEFLTEHATDPNMKNDTIFSMWSNYLAESLEEGKVADFSQALENKENEIAEHLIKMHQETSKWQFLDPKTRGPLLDILAPLVEAFVHFLSNFFTIKNSQQAEQLKEPDNVPKLINKIKK